MSKAELSWDLKMQIHRMLYKRPFIAEREEFDMARAQEVLSVVRRYRAKRPPMSWGMLASIFWVTEPELFRNYNQAISEGYFANP